MCNSRSIRGFIDHASIGRRGASDPAVVQLVLSEAPRHLALSDEEIVAEVTPEYRALWPPARAAQVRDAVVERIGAAMVRCAPDAFWRRPDTDTGIVNLFLAGDWVRHDPKPTMEGAVASGRAAANRVLRATARPSAAILSAPEGRLITLARRVRDRAGSAMQARVPAH
jgi:uncharacterized protein with NAD-binding domain and iron-sulfur cluster